MKIANQLTFTTYEASLKLNWNAPIKIIFDNIDCSFIISSGQKVRPTVIPILLMGEGWWGQF